MSVTEAVSTTHARIFLSYKRNVEPDQTLAPELVAGLSGAGHAVFIDQRLTVGQKEEAEYQAAQAAVQRDEAVRRRQVAEDSFNKRARDLERTEKLAEKLETSTPAAAAAVGAAIGSLVAQAKEEVQKDRATLGAPGPANEPTRNTAGRGTTRPDRTPQPAPSQPVVKPTPPPPLTADQLAIRRVLDAYQAGYRSGDVKAVQAVQLLTPEAQKRVVAEFARGQHVVQIDTEDIRVSADGRSALVNARVRRRIVSGGNSDSVSVELFTMQKRRDRWVIISVGPAS